MRETKNVSHHTQKQLLQHDSLLPSYSQYQDHGHILQWRHNKRDGVSNHRRLDCLLNCLFRRRSKKTSKLRATGLCEGKSPVTGEFPTQRASNTEMLLFDDVTMHISYNSFTQWAIANISGDLWDNFSSYIVPNKSARWARSLTKLQRNSWNQ